MTVQTGEVLKAVVEFILANGTIIQNIYHFFTGFVTPQDDDDVVDAIVDYAEEVYASLLSDMSATMTSLPMTVHVVVWDGVEGKWVTDRLVGIDTPIIVGTGTADLLPNQNSAVVIADTARPKSRGRKFFPPFEDTSAVGSEWGAGVITNLALALTQYLMDQVVTPGNDLNPGVPRTGVNEYLPFQSGMVNSVVGSQRRRKLGLGE